MENHLPCAPSAQAAPRGNRKHLGRDAGRARPTASRVHNPYKLTPVAENEAPASDDPDLRDLTQIFKTERGGRFSIAARRGWVPKRTWGLSRPCLAVTGMFRVCEPLRHRWETRSVLEASGDGARVTIIGIKGDSWETKPANAVTDSHLGFCRNRFEPATRTFSPLFI